MPELPEVETVMRGLSRHMQGHRITEALIRRPDLRRPLPPDLAAQLTGARVLGFRRRAKYIAMRLDRGTTLLIHLGMSGRMVLNPEGPPARHEHMRLTLENGGRLGFIDPRRFGSLDLLATTAEDDHPSLCALGPEPLDATFIGKILAARLAGSTTTLKAALLDQRRVAGLGNIYVAEALFRARLAPQREAGSLTLREAGTLARAIQATLRDAIAAGGSSLRDYVQPDGELGYFQHQWKVYGRAGQPCERCPRLRPHARASTCPLIAHAMQAGRSSFWCPRTQT